MHHLLWAEEEILGYFISSAHATPFTCGERDGDTGGGMLVVGSSISPVDSTLLDRKWCEGFVGDVVWVWGDSISLVRRWLEGGFSMQTC